MSLQKGEFRKEKRRVKPRVRAELRKQAKNAKRSEETLQYRQKHLAHSPVTYRFGSIDTQELILRTQFKIANEHAELATGKPIFSEMDIERAIQKMLNKVMKFYGVKEI